MLKNPSDSLLTGDRQPCDCPEKGKPKTWAFFSAPKNDVEVIAHRGGNGEWPGETIIAFTEAKDIGVDVLELDVWGTCDNPSTLILVHWRWLRKTTESYRFLPGCSLDYIQKLNGAYQWTPDKGKSFPYRKHAPTVRIATLKEALERFGHMRMVIEIKQKSPSIVAPLLDLIEGTDGMRDRVLIASFYTKVIKEVREQSKGEIATSMSSWETLKFYVRTYLLRGKYLPPAAAVQIKGRFWFPPVWMITKGFVRRAQCLGYKVQGWTIDDPDDMRRAIHAGVDGIITDFPTRLLAVRKEEEQRMLARRNIGEPK
jgi:glycerophosphoryl diester phosphodiesterase